ncbi:MAG: hypothetical protein Q4D23_03300 [Bacteroidales bacterium]|nr:hypothetical protein [Bacteroidales bacterium]
MALSFDSTVKEVLDDPEGVKILDELIPGMSTDPRTAMAYAIPMRALMAFPANGFPQELQDEMEKRLTALSE